jgi:hypothetical protein
VESLRGKLISASSNNITAFSIAGERGWSRLGTHRDLCLLVLFGLLLVRHYDLRPRDFRTCLQWQPRPREGVSFRKSDTQALTRPQFAMLNTLYISAPLCSAERFFRRSYSSHNVDIDSARGSDGHQGIVQAKTSQAWINFLSFTDQSKVYFLSWTLTLVVCLLCRTCNFGALR